MNRLIKNLVSSIVFAVLICSVSVFAVTSNESIKTENLTVKTDRLFEVKVGFDSSRTITAARFKLKYNKNNIAIRQTVCNIGSAKVRFNDTEGLTDVIFLCSNGVNCSEYPTLFSVKYKKLNDNDTKISIHALDCVDNNVKNFTPPKSAVCKIKGVAGSSLSSSAKSGKKGSSKGGSFSTKSSNSNNTNDNDVLDTSGKSGSSVTQDEEEVKFDDDDNLILLKIIPFVFLFVILLFFGIILYQNIQLKKAEKRRQEEDESEQ